MASIHYYLRDPKSKNETLIYLALSFEGRRYKFSTIESVLPKFWNSEEQKVRKTHPGHQEINDSISKKGADLLTAIRLLKNLNQRISTDTLKRKMDEINKVVNKENKSFLGFIEEYIRAAELQVAEGTIKSYKTTLAVLRRFQQSRNRRLEFNSIDLNFHDEFEMYLQKKLNYAKNTAGKHIKNVKVFMRQATERGLNNNMEFLKKGFRAGKEDIDNIYLTEEELDIIYNLDLSGAEKMEHVRDLFIVGCWTGLRFSDFSQIKNENIKDGIITLRMQKTGDLVSIPVHPVVNKIMLKYKGKYANGLPPAYENQVMNVNLKEIGKRAGLFEEVTIRKTKGGKKTETVFKKYQLVTTHTARRSFATNLYKQGFPSISIMKITGHRSEKNFLNYIKLAPRENAEKLRLHWAQLEEEKKAALRKSKNGTLKIVRFTA